MCVCVICHLGAFLVYTLCGWSSEARGVFTLDGGWVEAMGGYAVLVIGWQLRVSIM